MSNIHRSDLCIGRLYRSACAVSLTLALWHAAAIVLLYAEPTFSQETSSSEVIALVSIQLDEQKSAMPTESIVRLKRVVQKHRGQILGAFTPNDSLIGEHEGTLLVLAELPNEATAKTLLKDPQYLSEGKIVLMVLGNDFVLSSHYKPPLDIWETDTARKADVFLVAASALVQGGTLSECRDQLKTILDLAKRYHGELYGSYQVTDVLVGEFKPALFVVVAWQSKAGFQSFGRRLLTPRLSDVVLRRPAHGLSPGQILLLESSHPD